MSLVFIWPTLLRILILIPLFLLAYRWVMNRRPRAAIMFPDTALLAAAARRAGPLRRHLSAGLFLFAVAAVVVAVARPVAPLPVPADRSTIMLAIDSSGSMRSQDILPTRLGAAQDAAKAFLRTVPPNVPVGLVSFGGFATLLVPPTTDRKRVVNAIDGLYFIRRTAIGEGLLEAVAALPTRGKPAPDGSLPPAPPGGRPPGVVILLSDGRSNAGIDPIVAASLARQQEVIVYTIGVGSKDPTSAWTIGGTLDDAELQSIARETGGEYFHATSAEGLKAVYQRLARWVGWERRPEEITALVGILGAIALIASLITARVFTQPVNI